MTDFTFDEKTYNFTEAEISQLVKFTEWYCMGFSAPYDMRKMRSVRVRQWVTDRLHCGLVENDGKYYACYYGNRPRGSIEFSPVWHLPPEIIWRIFNNHIFNQPTGSDGNKKTVGYSIKKSRGWTMLNVNSADSSFFCERDDKSIWETLRILTLHQYIIFQSAGSVWMITER